MDNKGDGTWDTIRSRWRIGGGVLGWVVDICVCMSVCMYVILLGVSGVAELRRPDPKMHDDGEGDDVWVELLPVQLVDTHGARFLREKQVSTVGHVTV